MIAEPVHDNDTVDRRAPDAIMLCSMMPGVVSAIRQIRNAGIEISILNRSGVDGSY